MKSVIFIAPPASGKGTQSAILEKLGYSHISAGDILRKEIESKSDFGLKIKDIMAKGNLVNDDDVHKLMRKAIIKAKKPFILDGYPRTSYQTNLLNNLFNELDINDYKVIYLDITLEEALKRSLGRLTCSCGASYNKYYENLKPQVEGICDVCGKKLIPVPFLPYYFIVVRIAVHANADVMGKLIGFVAAECLVGYRMCYMI